MSSSYRPLAFTETVLDAQVRYGSRAALDRLDRTAPSTDGHGSRNRRGKRDIERALEDEARDALTEGEREFIASRDGFYLATVSGGGWPYVQFRGGPPGFVTATDEHTISWPDFRGNRQYISTGNLAYQRRVSLIFMDYPHQLRLKVFGRASVRDAPSPSEAEQSVEIPGYRAKVERLVRVEVAAYDWNCPQHITPRYSDAELAPILGRLRERVNELQAENATLRRPLSINDQAAF